ncbi:MAG: permease [Sphaerochaetaceae bacterium]
MNGKLSTYWNKRTKPARLLKTGVILAGIAAWVALYLNLQRISGGIVSALSGLVPVFAPGSRIYDALSFFLFETPKVFMLLFTIVFVVGIIRTFFSPERTRRLLARRGAFTGNVLGALLGIVTPFCSCSAVPLFIGFLSAGVPLGATFSFLVSAPMVNEVALVLLFGLFGWKVAALYLGTGLLVAMVSGFVLGRLKLDSWVEDWVWEIRSGNASPDEVLSWDDRFRAGRDAVKEIVGRVWKWVVLGIALGAGIHGYVPQNFFVKVLGAEAWWAVPLAILFGVPMYSNAAGIVPIISALLDKGAALGTSLAFMMAVIALSLPEAILLRKVLKPKLLAVFFGIVAVGIMIVGYLFNALFAMG